MSESRIACDGARDGGGSRARHPHSTHTGVILDDRQSDEKKEKEEKKEKKGDEDRLKILHAFSPSNALGELIVQLQGTHPR